MSIPKHSENIREDRKAVAPYNFVPLPEEIKLIENPPSQGFYDKGLLTGQIHCVLTNETPLYVRASQTPPQFENGDVSSEAFYYNDPKEQLLIPGSSIRGMLRNLVEVVSQARISSVSDKQLFYRSVEDTSMGVSFTNRMRDKVQAGFFHRNQSEAWITPTIALRVERAKILREFGGDSLYEEQYRHGQRLRTSPKRVPREELQHQSIFVSLDEKSLDNPNKFYTTQEISREESDGLVPAILVITGDMQVRPDRNGIIKEKKEFAFLKRSAGTKIILHDEQMELFEDRDQLTAYQENAFPETRGRKLAGYLKDGDPVFYLLDNHKVTGFGRAYMFRLPYESSPAQMLPDALSGDPNRYDLAESLFGYVSGEKSERKAVASRVIITDALMQGDLQNVLLPETQLKILSSPKPTSFQHYLTQRKPNDPDDLFHYDSSKTETTLRGHKFYWHKNIVDRNDKSIINESAYTATENELRELKTQLSHPIKPVKPGQSFTFTIQYENLRPEELGSLLWVLDKAMDENYRLKLGMGKPYGLGSISIYSTYQIEDRKKRYKKLFEDHKWFIAEDEQCQEKLQDARLAFARWLLKRRNATFEHIDEQKRIQELLIMLSWNEFPPDSKTRYMVLDEFSGKLHMVTGERGYFPKRPVLPAPHSVFGKWLKEPAPKVYTPVKLPPDQLSPGDFIQASVFDKDSNGDVFLSCEHHDEDDLCVVRSSQRKPRDYSLDLPNILVLLEVLEVKKENHYWIVECQTVIQE